MWRHVGRATDLVGEDGGMGCAAEPVEGRSEHEGVGRLPGRTREKTPCVVGRGLGDDVGCFHEASITRVAPDARTPSRRFGGMRDGCPKLWIFGATVSRRASRGGATGRFFGIPDLAVPRGPDTFHGQISLGPTVPLEVPVRDTPNVARRGTGPAKRDRAPSRERASVRPRAGRTRPCHPSPVGSAATSCRSGPGSHPMRRPSDARSATDPSSRW